MRESDEMNETIGTAGPLRNFVPILYRGHAFEAFDDFNDFVESVSCESSESCQVRGSNPCRGASHPDSKSLHPLFHRNRPRMPNLGTFSRSQQFSALADPARSGVS